MAITNLVATVVLVVVTNVTLQRQHWVPDPEPTSYLESHKEMMQKLGHWENGAVPEGYVYPYWYTGQQERDNPDSKTVEVVKKEVLVFKYGKTTQTVNAVATQLSKTNVVVTPKEEIAK